MRRNPSLVVFGNPGKAMAGMLSRHVYQIQMRPEQGGRIRTVNFGTEQIQARAVGNGTVELRATTKGQRPFERLDGFQVQRIRYRHVEDGEDYQHEFEPGAFLIAPRGVSAVIFRRDGKPVWGEF